MQHVLISGTSSTAPRHGIFQIIKPCFIENLEISLDGFCESPHDCLCLFPLKLIVVFWDTSFWSLYCENNVWNPSSQSLRTAWNLCKELKEVVWGECALSLNVVCCLCWENQILICCAHITQHTPPEKRWAHSIDCFTFNAHDRF